MVQDEACIVLSLIMSALLFMTWLGSLWETRQARKRARRAERRKTLETIARLRAERNIAELDAYLLAHKVKEGVKKCTK